jgi:hypothetical protein
LWIGTLSIRSRCDICADCEGSDAHNIEPAA